MISEIIIIKEFTTEDNITYGVYSVIFNNIQSIFIRNGDSVGTVVFYWGKPANECIDIIRDDVKEEFLKKLSKMVDKVRCEFKE